MLKPAPHTSRSRSPRLSLAIMIMAGLWITVAGSKTYAQATSSDNQLTLSTQPSEPAPAAPAQLTESSITAIPPRLGEDFTLKAKPGEKIQTSVRVRNGSSEKLLLKTTAQDFIVGDNGETPVPITDTDLSNRWSLASWMILTPSVNEVAPGQSVTVNVIIDVPANALPGGHYAMITHQPTTANNNPAGAGGPASASFLQQRVGTLVYLMVEGPINEAAFIRKLTIPHFTEYGPVPFSFEVDNRSDIHIHPTLSVEIYNIFGRKVETIPIESKNVFPFIPRAFSGQWNRIWGVWTLHGQGGDELW